MRRLLMLLPAALSLITKRAARRPLTRRYLNRLFLTAEEAKTGQVTLDDRRAEHVKKIIWRGAPPPNATLRVGVLDGQTADCAASLDGQGRLMLELPESLSTPSKRPRLDVILALPAPLRLKRILPTLSSLGVDNLWLCGAARTERSYFGAKFLEGLKRDSVPRAAPAGKLRDLLVEGAEQSGDSALPKVALAGSLRPALRAAAGRANMATTSIPRSAGLTPTTAAPFSTSSTMRSCMPSTSHSRIVRRHASRSTRSRW